MDNLGGRLDVLQSVLTKLETQATDLMLVRMRILSSLRIRKSETCSMFRKSEQHTVVPYRASVKQKRQRENIRR